MVTGAEDMVCGTRTVDPLLPAESGTLHGLAFTLWLPPPPQPSADAGVVVLHGAGSGKESHHDFARAAVAQGLGVICFDQRGHGASAGPMDDRILDDVALMAGHLRRGLGGGAAPIALRGSSMGGYLAIIAAGPARARAVVAICPAGADDLRRGLLSGRFALDVDRERMAALLDAHDLVVAVAGLQVPLLIMHAEGDEQVPVEHSRELAAAMTAAGSRLITVPGGHHRSIQHDDEMQAVSLRFLRDALRAPVE